MSVVVHLCVCPYVSNCMEKKLYFFETTMYFRNFYYLVIILLWGVSKGEVLYVIKIWLKYLKY